MTLTSCVCFCVIFFQLPLTVSLTDGTTIPFWTECNLYRCLKWDSNNSPRASTKLTNSSNNRSLHVYSFPLLIKDSCEMSDAEHEASIISNFRSVPSRLLLARSPFICHSSNTGSLICKSNGKHTANNITLLPSVSHFHVGTEVFYQFIGPTRKN